MIKDNKKLYADLGLLLVAILWGTTFVVSKIILEKITPMYIISIRFFLAFVIISLVYNKKIKNINLYEFKGGLVIGIIFFIAFGSQLIALQYTNPGKQAFLAGAYVIIVPFLYWIINKRRPRTKSFLATFICLLGIGLLTIKGNNLSISYGDSLTLVSSAFFAAHIIAISYYIKKIEPVKIAIIQFGVVAILSFVFAIIFEPFPVNLDLSASLAILYLGVFCTGIAYFVQIVAQKYTEPTHVAILLSLEAVFGSILSVIVINEVFTIQMIFGCIAIFIAILVSELQ